MGKAALIIVLGSILLYTVFNSNINSSMNLGYDVAVDRFSEVQARHTAYSMINILLSRLADDGSYRAESPVTEDLFSGTATYRVLDTIFVTPDTIQLVKIVATSNYNGETYSITTYTQAAGWVPPPVRGAWTANADLNNTISDMYIDGRDHDLDGNIIPGAGQPAVSSATTFTNMDNAKIGGTYDGVDYPMTYPENPLVIEQNHSWDGGFPTTPDEILGYPEGTLKAIAQSGVEGSQYVLNPGKTIDGDDLNFPISGVTYIEITDGKETEWKSATITEPDRGILVIRAPDGSSRAKGVKMDETEEPFIGLLITDYSFHHHLDILGAVIQLSPNLEDDKNCNGNEDHWVYFSSEAIIAATEVVAKETGLTGNSAEAIYFGTAGAIGSGRQKVVHWWE